MSERPPLAEPAWALDAIHRRGWSTPREVDGAYQTQRGRLVRRASSVQELAELVIVATPPLLLVNQ